MPIGRANSTLIASMLFGATFAACSSAPDAEPTVVEQKSALTDQQRLTACAQDPRVQAGLVSQRICAGADIFFNETFNGNGRTCGTCHSAKNNTTLDVPFIDSLPPTDPLFVFQNNPALGDLDHHDDIFLHAVVLENVDGFDDPTHKFVGRSVPHLLSMSTSIAPDTGDGTTNPPINRTGWGGDGAPGDGSLRSFLSGAITQHYPKTLARVPGTDFRLPTSLEADLVNEFQLALGRTNDLDLTTVNLFDPVANQGRQAFLDPQRGRCNICHMNAGANSFDTGKNRNFDTGNRAIVAGATVAVQNGVALFDGGFGGAGLTQPNFDVFNFDPQSTGTPNAFGNGTFNTPPLIEAADTPPFFHNNQDASTDIEDAVFFYLGPFPFTGSPAALALQARFGTPIQFSVDDGLAIARFLRVLNVAFNLDIAKQRLTAAETLVNLFHDTRADIQIGLANLAMKEINDALGVLTSSRTAQPFLPVAVDRLGLANAEIVAAVDPSATWGTRQNHISNAISRVLNARDQVGDNVTFNLGQGNLMF